MIKNPTNLLLAAASTACAAAPAVAQLSYTNQSCTISEATFLIVGDNDYSPPSTQFGPQTMFGPQGAFQATEQTFSTGGSYGPYPAINSVNANYSVTTRADSQGLRFSWNGTSSGSVATDQLTPNDLAATDLTVRLGTIITVQSDTRLRFEFNAASSTTGLVENTDHFLLSSVEAGYSNSSLFADFRGGFDDDFNNPSFVFEIDAAAGSTFDFTFDLALGVFAYGVGNGFDWNHFTSGSVSISVVPAPASACVLGLVGIVTARRRRA
jgi:hypothetical protein